MNSAFIHTIGKLGMQDLAVKIRDAYQASRFHSRFIIHKQAASLCAAVEQKCMYCDYTCSCNCHIGIAKETMWRELHSHQLGGDAA